MEREPLTGINVVIVGGGIGGLAAAIELHRKGHTVRGVYERQESFNTLSDLILLGKSAQRGMLNWPGFLPRLLEDAMAPQIAWYKYDGTHIITAPDSPSEEGLAQIPIWRRTLHEEFYRYATDLGIKVYFGKKAARYFESHEEGKVEFEDGEIVGADLVVAADGIATKATELIVESPETPTSSGYGIYRRSYALDHALKDPLIREVWGGSREGMELWMNKDCHVVIANSKKTNNICYMITHKGSEDTAEELWSADCPASNALPFLSESNGWPPYLRALVEQTPDNRCVDWKLMWRNPQPKWSSPLHRVLQLGDSAHAFLPTSGSGAVQAIEDGFSLAACLSLSGKADVPLGVRVHNKLRFERVAFIQRIGFENREIFHHPDWDKFAKDPTFFVKISRFNDWIFNHDVGKYVYESFEACKRHLLYGEPFENTNGPPDAKYEPWTVQSLTKEAEANREAGKVSYTRAQ